MRIGLRTAYNKITLMNKNNYIEQLFKQKVNFLNQPETNLNAFLFRSVAKCNENTSPKYRFISKLGCQRRRKILLTTRFLGKISPTHPKPPPVY